MHARSIGGIHARPSVSGRKPEARRTAAIVVVNLLSADSAR